MVNGYALRLHIYYNQKIQSKIKWIFSLHTKTHLPVDKYIQTLFQQTTELDREYSSSITSLVLRLNTAVVAAVAIDVSNRFLLAVMHACLANNSLHRL